VSRGSASESTPRRTPRSARAPLERGRAAGLLTGLAAFAIGFAAAGVLVLAGAGGSPGYLISVTVGLVGVGLVGFFLHRGTVPLPEGAKLWSPGLLRVVLEPLGLPARPVILLLYLLTAIGLIGNLVVPLLLRR
jgi:hypothetical protein